MEHLVHAVRRLLLATVAVAVLVGFVTAFASAAAKPNRPAFTFIDPSPGDGGTFIASAGGNSVTYAFTYNRTPKQTQSVICTLSGPNNYSSTGNCANLAAFGSSGSQSTGNTYSNLANGHYTFTVSLTLTDHGTATATQHFAIRSGSFEELAPIPHVYVLGTDWFPADSSGATTADLQPAGGIIIPPTPAPSSTSGCTAADFTGFVPGRIALIQRGGCNFGVKVLNAEAAGASGVVIFNEGNNPARMPAFSGILVDANGNLFTASIPVVFTSFDIGQDLYNQTNTSPPVLHLSIN